MKRFYQSSIPLTIVVLSHIVFQYASGFQTSEERSKRVLAQSANLLRTGFIENKGQFGAITGEATDVLFAANRGSVRMFFTSRGISYVSSFRAEQQTSVSEASGAYSDRSADMAKMQGFRLDVMFEGARKDVTVKAYGRQQSQANFYLPDWPDGLLGIPEYDRLVYQNLYPGIDLVFLLSKDVVRYEFIVHPGGNPKDIAFRTEGTDDFLLETGGSFVMRTPFGGVRETAPYSFQPGSQGNIPVESRFALRGSLRTFEIGAFDHTRTLVIDPWVTYYGGNGNDKGNVVTTDPAKDILFAGETQSWDLPVTPGAFQDSTGRFMDVFFARFSNAGARRYVTYYGGSGNDYCYGIAVAGNREVVITGATSSTNFPVGGGAFASTNKGMDDAFIVKFDSNGARLWATYYGGGGYDHGLGIAVDSSRNIIVTGKTASQKPNTFPTTNNSFQQTSGGLEDGFIIKFTPTGKRIWATHIGGAGCDQMTGITIGERDYIYLCGWTWSLNFPVTPGAYQSSLAGTTNSEDAVLAKFDSSGGRLWSTYFGGDKVDIANEIAIDKNRNITIAGRAASTNFPVTTGAFQTTLAGGIDGFFASFDAQGALRWSTLFGGAGEDEAMGICTDTLGYVYMTGHTMSLNLPVTTSAAQPQNGGLRDAFIAKFDSVGSRNWATYFGGSGDDYGIAVTALGANVYVTGSTESPNLPLYNPFQTTKSTGSDAFFTLITNGGVIPVELTSFSAIWNEGNAVLTWETEGETGNFGFEIERIENQPGAEWTMRGFVPGNGTTMQRRKYTFTETLDPSFTNMKYRLKQIDFNGSYEYSQMIELSEAFPPTVLEVFEVYPNPARTSASVSFRTPFEGALELTLFSSDGRKAQSVLRRDEAPAGYHSVPFSVENLIPGVYFLRIQTNTQRLTEKILVTR